MENNGIELLAPAGGPEQLAAAVACGADAVYLGVGALNARRNAANFAGDALRQAVEYCHIRGVKVHLTMNTVVLERELDEAETLAREACAIGVDALIVQDLGLIRMLRRCAPKMPLHASTQMAVHNLAGARLLEEMGFARVVLAREMSRAEIAKVTRQTSLETEVFIHGALCMCVSGQCYMSAVIGERSGNRGMCAQPCRLPFYERQAGRCGLSLKDLSLVEQAAELRELGVASLKIEGRMKRPEYVAAAVTACKQALGGQIPDLNQLRLVFSRTGFTDGYYKGMPGPDMFGTRQKEDVVSAQGVLGELARLYQREAQRVGLDGSLTLRAGEPVELTASDQAGRRAAVRGNVPEPARSKPTTPELIEQSLQKLGGTPYYWERLDIECEAGLALPVSQLNFLRREVVEAISSRRAEGIPVDWTPIEAGQFQPKPPSGRPELRGRFARLEQIPDNAYDILDKIILPVNETARVEDPQTLKKLMVELPRIRFDSGSADGSRAAGETTADMAGCGTPLLKTRGMGDGQEEKAWSAEWEQLQALRGKGVTHAVAGNLGAVWIARGCGFTVTGDWALNVTNSQSLQMLAEIGCAEATLSWELNLSDARRLPRPLPWGMVAYGYLPLMVVRNCPARAERSCASCPGTTRMSDRLGNRFYVSCGGSRRVTEIYNHVPLWMADRMAEFGSPDFLTMAFTLEPRDRCARVLEAYRTGEDKPEAMTRGLYYRNIR